MPSAIQRRSRGGRSRHNHNHQHHNDYVEVDTAQLNGHSRKRGRQQQHNHHQHQHVPAQHTNGVIQDEDIASDELDSDYDSAVQYVDAPESSSDDDSSEYSSDYDVDEQDGDALEVVGVGYGQDENDNTDRYYEYVDYDYDNERPSKKQRLVDGLSSKQQQKLIQLLEHIQSESEDDDDDEMESSVSSSDDENGTGTPVLRVVPDRHERDTGDVIDDGEIVSSDSEDLTSESSSSDSDESPSEEEMSDVGESDDSEALPVHSPVEFLTNDAPSEDDELDSDYDEEEALVRSVIINELKERSNKMINTTIHTLVKSITDIYSGTHSVRRAERETKALLHQKLGELSDAITFVHSDIGNENSNIAEIAEQ